jgi:hypothetical protein
MSAILTFMSVLTLLRSRAIVKQVPFTAEPLKTRRVETYKVNWVIYIKLF